MSKDEKIKTLKMFVGEALNYDVENLLFLTLRLNDLYSQEIVLKSCKDTISTIYCRLYGKRWKKKPFKCFAVTEHGKGNRNHMHLILNTCNKTTEQFVSAVKKAAKRRWLNLCYDYVDMTHESKNWVKHKNHLLIEPVYSKYNLMGYLLKEINFNGNTLDLSNIYVNEMLFD